MGLKELFDDPGDSRIVAKKSIDEIGAEVESADYIRAYIEDKSRFIPQVDFSKPENFAIFGSAEQYYENAIKRIYQEYPYDGSLKEKLQWHLTSSYFDNYFFENEYPRTTGYATLCADGWGTRVESEGEYGAPASASYEYIQIKGGPHKDATNTLLSDVYPSEGGTANIYNTSDSRESNLKYDLQNNGVTVEFWLKKDAFSPIIPGGTDGSTDKEVVFDLWNGEISSSAQYGRLRIELSGTAERDDDEYENFSPWRITAYSGSTGFSNQQIGTGSFSSTGSISTVTTGSLATWKHYAFSFLSASHGTKCRFYVNGKLNDERTVGTDPDGNEAGFNEVTGNLIANIGALRAAPAPIGPVALGSSDYWEMEGWGKLSASMDEFRFWKTQRSSEQIGRFWFTQVGAGTNTDTANTNLGVYYKFNEGITGDSSTDSVVLDYSGRLSNGTWTGYVGSTSRNTGSAIVSGAAASFEFEDPIIRTNNSTLKDLIITKRSEGKEYDYLNNASLYYTLPEWIIQDDHKDKGSTGELLKLFQIMSSYLDNLHLQIEALNHLQDINYVSSSNATNLNKPLPFANKLLVSHGFVAPDLFTDSTVLENFLDRDEDREYEFSLHDVKNFIYQNVYNNLTGIYKKKGTEASFRNLIRCFGIDDNLIKINLYADNTTYLLEDNYREASIRKSLVDFYHTDRFSATVHQYADPDNANTVSYITASQGTQESGIPLTVEAEIVFPRKRDPKNQFYTHTSFITSSLFGMHTAKSGDSTNLTFENPDETNFQIFACRNDTESLHAKFMLTSSDGGHLNEGIDHLGSTVYKLTSSVYPDVYNDERWLLAFRLKRTKSPFVGEVDGTESDTYTVNLYGVNPRFGHIANEFEVSGTISDVQGLRIMKNPKRIFAGAHRTNFTGSVLNESDVKVGAVRAWYNYLDNDTLKAHALDPLNYGHSRPFKRSFLFEDNLLEKDIKNIETLALNWDFQTLTSSNASGEFVVPDFSSGSAENTNRHGYISNVINNQHAGRGYGFVANSTGSIDRNYMHSYVYQLPEILSNKDTVKILENDDKTFFRDKRPVKFFHAVEKSLYQDISLEMLNMFSTMKDFNNLIGEPVNRYRQHYKDLEKLRQLYFERVRNTPDFEKFVEFYKWFDSALGQMILELIPASSKFSRNVRNMVESHILERNKYWTKFPTLEMKVPKLDAGIKGNINAARAHELTPPPTADLGASDDQGTNHLWWEFQAVVDDNSSGDAGVDGNREEIHEVVRQTRRRSESTPHRLSVEKGEEFRGGPTTTVNRRRDLHTSNLKPLSTNTITISVNETDKIVKDLEDRKLKTRIDTLGEVSFSPPTTIKGDMVAPFSIFSSSANPHLQIAAGKEITNLHNDGYGNSFEVPVQGPFTNQHVGGLQYRHANLNYIADANDTLDDELTRAEGFRIQLASDTAIITQPEKDSAGTINLDLPTLRYYRDGTSKRPLNIRNIKHVTGSLSVLGNYNEDREIIQTSNRKINNRWFVEEVADVSTTTPVILFDSDGFTTAISSSSTYISGVIEYEKPVRGKNKHVIVERFSAPGGPETAGDADGGPGLDALSAEYSVYNTMNWRNVTVRTPLNEFSTDHCGQFGLHKDYALGSGDPVSASFHKIHKNELRRIELSTDGTVVTASVYDNFFVQHPIPRSDLQYLWISSSVAQSSPAKAPFGFAKDPRTFPAEAEVVTFLTTGQVSADNNFVDFVGLNTLVHEPVDTSTNTISASKNNSIASLATAEVLNASLLNRNGPYGYPMWKQFRTAEHPIARYQRKNNIIDYIRKPNANDIKTFIQGGITHKVVTPDYNRRKSVAEPAIASSCKPITTGLLVFNDETNSYTPITIRHTYGNNISYFSNTVLNNNLKNIKNNNFDSVKRYNQMYDSIKELYIENAGSVDNLFVYVHVSETIYPRSRHMYSARTRGLPEYNVKDILGWRASRSDRDVSGYGLGNSQVGGDSTLDVRNESSWPLDARHNKNATAEDASFENGTALIIETPTGTGISTQNTKAGELLNSYSQFHVGLPDKIMPGTLYARLEPEYMSGDGEVIRDIIPVAGGAAKWEVGAQSGQAPFYDTYEEYSEEMKRIGKDYGVPPEFMISNHIEYYVETNKNDVVNADLPDDLFRLDGAHLSSSALTGTLFDNSFFSICNHTDFMSNIDQIQSDHEKYGGDLTTNLTLQCSAIIKFKPYEGFYPAQRTLQLSTLFSQSYGASVELSGNNHAFHGTPLSWRTALQPFFAPGILYNSIKSGIACDFPIMTGSYTNWSGHVKRTAGLSALNEEKYGYFPEIFLPKDVNRLSASFYALTHASKIHKFHYVSGSKLHGGFDYRIPFEGIIDPISLGGLSNLKYHDYEVHPSAAIDSYCTFVSPGKDLYKLGMNNFLANVVDFFLKGSQMTTLASEPRDVVSFDTDKEYIMDIILDRSTNLTPTASADLNDAPLASFPEIYDAISSSYNASIIMYDRESAFGPPVSELIISSSTKRYAFFGCAPYTPPYYDGRAGVLVRFQPTSTTHNFEEVINGARYEFYRNGILSGTYPNLKWETSGSFAYSNAMQITASVNIDTVLRRRTLEFDADSGDLRTVIEQPGSTGYQWVIEPKWETPIFDFSASLDDLALPVSGSGSAARGMWHQYGSTPTDSSKGIFLSLEFPEKVDGVSVNTRVTSSLLHACGFDTFNQTLSKRLGTVGDSKTVSEALVAIPFMSETRSINNINEIKFLNLAGRRDPKKARELIDKALAGKTVPESISHMVDAMQRFILPPKFDFIKWKNMDPFPIYIFEFEWELDGQDLKNIWQNVSPPSGKHFKMLSSKISHDIKIGELFGNKEQKNSLSDCRWLVFKAKQRGEKFYNNKTLAGFDNIKYIRSFGVESAEAVEKEYPYSYNWPYDYFSLIELVKINAGVTIVDDKNYSKIGASESEIKSVLTDEE